MLAERKLCTAGQKTTELARTRKTELDNIADCENPAQPKHVAAELARTGETEFDSVTDCENFAQTNNEPNELDQTRVAAIEAR